MSSDELLVPGSVQAQGKGPSLRDALLWFLCQKVRTDVFEGLYSLPNLGLETSNVVSYTKEEVHLCPCGDLVASMYTLKF